MRAQLIFIAFFLSFSVKSLALEGVRCKNILDLELSLLGFGDTRQMNLGVTKQAYNKNSTSTSFKSKIGLTEVTYFDFDAKNLSGMGSVLSSSTDGFGNRLQKKVFISGSCNVSRILITDIHNPDGVEITDRICKTEIKLQFKNICKAYSKYFNEKYPTSGDVNKPTQAIQ